MRVFLKSNAFHALMLAVCAACAVLILFPQHAYAAEGSEIFAKAARAVLQKVLPGSFGAVVAVIAGIVALIAAATGSYRSAWTIVFVSVACFLADNLVSLLFDY